MTAYLAQSNMKTKAKAANGFKIVAIAKDICSVVIS